MVSAILLLGGSASISALTGMDIRAATMLLPVGVIAFVIVGGLRSTFVSDYAHTTIVFVIIWLFVYTVRRAARVLYESSERLPSRRMGPRTRLGLPLPCMPFSSRLQRLIPYQVTGRGLTSRSTPSQRSSVSIFSRRALNISNHSIQMLLFPVCSVPPLCSLTNPIGT